MTVFQIYRGAKPNGTLTVDGEKYTLDTNDREFRRQIAAIWEEGVEFKTDESTKTIHRVKVEKLPASEETIGLVEERLEEIYTLQEKEPAGEV